VQALRQLMRRVISQVFGQAVMVTEARVLREQAEAA